QRQVAALPGFKAQLEQLLQDGKTGSGRTLTDEERAGYSSDIGLISRYLADAPSFHIVLPTIAVADRLTLHRGARDVEIRFLGGGHTAGDLVVYLPKERSSPPANRWLPRIPPSAVIRPTSAAGSPPPV